MSQNPHQIHFSSFSFLPFYDLNCVPKHNFLFFGTKSVKKFLSGHSLRGAICVFDSSQSCFLCSGNFMALIIFLQKFLRNSFLHSTKFVLYNPRRWGFHFFPHVFQVYFQFFLMFLLNLFRVRDHRKKQTYKQKSNSNKPPKPGADRSQENQRKKNVQEKQD